MFQMKNISRSDSVCPDPKSDLLKYVFENNVVQIRNVLQRNKQIVNEKFDFPYLKPILYIALLEKAKTITADVIDVLIELGANLYFSNEDWNDDGKDAIHFAALGGNPQILKRIIRHISKEKINATTKNGSNALLLLIKDGNANDPDFTACVQILLESGIEVNKTTDKNASAIYWAAKRNYMDVINILLDVEGIDLDNVFNKKTARNLLQNMGVDVSLIPVHSIDNLKEDSVQLLRYLKESKELNFLELANRIGIDNEDANEKTYLQIACEKHLLKVVEFLLEKNVDLNRASRKCLKPPIEIAAENGYYKIFKLLIESRYVIVDHKVLSEVLRKLDYECNNDINYYMCYDYLMKYKKIDVNMKDNNGNFPLHYGAKYGGPEVALSLLQSKASLANKNNYGFLTLAEIDYETLKEHLDSCIEAQPSNKLDKENMTISFDYATLLPTIEKTENLSTDEVEKSLNNEIRNLVVETEAVLYMSRSSELKSLLKHPVITSFLYMKWHRIRWIFYTNVLFYLTFCLALILHSITLYNSTKTQGFTYFFLLLMLLLIFMREFFQILVAPVKYIQNFENYIEISLIVVVLLMLIIKTPSDKTRNQLCAFAFLLAAFELLFLLGNYPSLSTNIVMLRTVSLNFFKFLLFYSILIIAFAFCFHILFNDTNSSLSLPSNNTETEPAEQTFFVNPFISMFKTLIMLTGEFEAGEINFEQYPITSHLIFLFFVITIAVILLNLLNGLAVSDTQEIRNEAELVGQIVRAEYTSYAESLIFSNILTSGFLDCYYNLFSCQGKNRNKRRVISRTLAEKICIFPNYLCDYKLIVYPNQNGRVHFETGEHSKWGCKNIYLDKKCIQRARALIQKKKEDDKRKKEKEEEANRIEALLNDNMQKIAEMLHSIK